MSDDLISRSEAIAFIKDHSYPVKYDRTSVENGMTLTGIECALRLLPAVARNILPAAVDDCVSRQAVIDCLKSISNMDPKERGSIVMGIELLPSVQPIVKSRTGHWVWKRRRRVHEYTVKRTVKSIHGIESKEAVIIHDEWTEDVNYCSVCGKRGDDTFFNYCPNCGAKMEEVNNNER